MQTCAISHCSRPAQSRKPGALCTAHYFIQWNGKDPESRVLPPLDEITCLVPECERSPRSNLLCVAHSNAAKQGIIPIPEGSTVTLNPICSFPGCGLYAASIKNGLCHSHYYQMRAGQPLHARGVLTPCSVPGCENNARKVWDGLCKDHYVKPIPKVLPRCSQTECNRFPAIDSDFCKRHGAQFARWGFTWPTGQRRPATPCAVGGCGKRSSDNTFLCDNHRLRASNYGLSHERLIALLSNAVCAACGSTERLSIDHDHSCCSGSTSCGKCVRGVLCQSCNFAYGFLGDQPSGVRALLEYAERTFVNRLRLVA